MTDHFRTTAALAMLVLTLAACAALAAAGSPAATADGPLSSPYAIEIPKWFTETLLDFHEDVADAARERKRLLLYFGQDGCPYCTQLMKVNFSQPDIVATTRASFVAIALNIWGDREVTWTDGRTMTEKELARLLKVQFTPTLLFLDEQGGVALRMNGYQPPERFRAALDYVRAQREKEQSFTDYLLQHPPLPAPAAAARHGAKLPALRDGDLHAMLRSAKPLLVVFEQNDCRACDEMHAEGFVRPEAKRLLARFRVVRLDFHGRRSIVTPSGKRMREGEWARTLRVAYTPTLVFFDRGGNEVFRTDGYVRPFHLASSLDYVASGAYRDEPSFQRFVKARAESLRGKGTQIDLWQ
jgi:thioredoxin-related protein